MSATGHSRRFDCAPLTSGLLRIADILRVKQHVLKVPKATMAKFIYSDAIPASCNASAKGKKTSGTIPTVTDQLRVVKVGSSSLTRRASAIPSSFRPSRISAAESSARETLKVGLASTARRAASHDF